MSEINLIFEVARDHGLEEVANSLQDRLGRLEVVKEVEAKPERMRLTGAEVAAVIGVTVVLVRGSVELVEGVRRLVAAVRGLAADLRDLKGVYVDVDNQRIPLDKLDAQHYERLAK